MIKMAVVKIGGSQYQVAPGQKVVVNKLVGDKGQRVIFDQILLIDEGEKVSIGQPVVKGAKVQAIIEEQIKGKKIRVATFRAKSRYRKVKGFRSRLSRIKINDVNG
jgi:large subunit ribosomal protein L21